MLDNGIDPILGGGAGLLGGYLVGKKVINPILQYRERDLINKLRTGEELLAKLRAGQRTAPILASAAGAILLASIAASRAKAKERERISDMLMYQQIPEQLQMAALQGAGGFYPHEQVSVGDPRSFY